MTATTETWLELMPVIPLARHLPCPTCSGTGDKPAPTKETTP